jgi:hypothetical protein
MSYDYSSFDLSLFNEAELLQFVVEILLEDSSLKLSDGSRMKLYAINFELTKREQEKNDNHSTS